MSFLILKNSRVISSFVAIGSLIWIPTTLGNGTAFDRDVFLGYLNGTYNNLYNLFIKDLPQENQPSSKKCYEVEAFFPDGESGFFGSVYKTPGIFVRMQSHNAPTAFDMANKVCADLLKNPNVIPSDTKDPSGLLNACLHSKDFIEVECTSDSVFVKASGTGGVLLINETIELSGF